MSRFKTQYNAQKFPERYEANVGPSLTVPDQSMSVRTILTRYAQGIPMDDNVRVPFYDGDEYVPDLNKLDLSEVEDLKIENKKAVHAAKKKLLDEKKARDQADYDRRKKTATEKPAATTNNPLPQSTSDKGTGNVSD